MSMRIELLRQLAIDAETTGHFPAYLALATETEQIAWLARQLITLIDALNSTELREQVQAHI
jgi:hypothetical protein